jgi:hypothetical protein
VRLVRLSFFVSAGLLTNAILAKLFSLLFSPPSCLCFLKTPDATRRNICREHRKEVLTNQSSSASTSIPDGVAWQWSGSLTRRRKKDNNKKEEGRRKKEEGRKQIRTFQYWYLVFFSPKNRKRRKKQDDLLNELTTVPVTVMVGIPKF